MKILNKQLQDDLAAGRLLRLDLGSGGPGRENFYGVDLMEMPGVDIQADLNSPLDRLPENSVSAIKSSHCFEHVTDFVSLMKELHRVVVHDGLIEITVPHFSNPHGYSDPTHVRFFGLYTFDYFTTPDKQTAKRVPNYFRDVRFNVEGRYINLMPRSLARRLAHPMLGRKINKSVQNQEYWETKLCWVVPGNEITYWIRPNKTLFPSKTR